jgi:acyl carrier protein
VFSLVLAAIREMAVRGLLPRDLADRELCAATRIDELGIDSLAKLDLLSELEARANVSLSEGMIAGLRTLGEIAGVLEQAQLAGQLP